VRPNYAMNTTTSPTVEEPAKRFAGFNVKKTVNGEAAITRLREMQKREAAIIAKYDLVLATCKKIEAEVVTAQREFDANPTPDGVHNLITIRLRAREATDLFASLYKLKTSGAANREFLSEHKKDLRAVLLQAATYRLAQAQQRFDAELAHSRQALGKEGFDQDEILQSPKVRSAKWSLEKFEGLVERIKQTEDGNLWQFAAEILK